MDSVELLQTIIQKTTGRRYTTKAQDSFLCRLQV